MTITRKKKIALCMMVVLLLCATMMSVFAGPLGVRHTFTANMYVPWTNKNGNCWNINGTGLYTYSGQTTTSGHTVKSTLYAWTASGDREEVSQTWSNTQKSMSVALNGNDCHFARIIAYNPNSNTNGWVQLS